MLPCFGTTSRPWLRGIGGTAIFSTLSAEKGVLKRCQSARLANAVSKIWPYEHANPPSKMLKVVAHTLPQKRAKRDPLRATVKINDLHLSDVVALRYRNINNNVDWACPGSAEM